VGFEPTISAGKRPQTYERVTCEMKYFETSSEIVHIAVLKEDVLKEDMRISYGLYNIIIMTYTSITISITARKRKR
jgi:hypothetical protein